MYFGTFSAVSLAVFLYLFSIKCSVIRAPGALLRMPLLGDVLRDYLRDEKLERLLRYAEGEAVKQKAEEFDTVMDYNGAVRLSRKMFQETPMYGQKKYSYRPHLKAVYVNNHQAGIDYAFALVDTPELRTILKPLKPQSLVSASFDENGFRHTDFNLDSQCDAYTLFAGDSFTEGFYAQEHETFVNQYGHLSNTSLPSRNCPINGGVNGYSALEERYVIEHFFEKYHYASVFLMHFPNDIHENYLDVISGEAPGLDLLWKGHLQELEKIADFCRSKNIRLVLAAIPPKEQLNHPQTRANYQDILRSFCQKKGILFIDLFEEFQKKGGEKLYLEWDAHFNSAGHLLTSQILWEKTKSRERENTKPFPG